SFFAVPIFFDNFLMFSPIDILTNIMLLGADWNLAFSHYPQLHWDATPNGLHQVWTLGAELTFYLIAPFLVRRISWLAAICLLSVFIRVVIVSLGFTGELRDTWNYHFIGSTMCFFLFGALIEWASRRFTILNSHAVGYAAIGVSVAIMAVLPDRGFETPRLWASLIFFVIGLPGIFDATRRGRLLNYAGDLSYPMYLVHIVVLVTASTFTLDLTERFAFGRYQGFISVLAFIGLCIAASIAAHHLLERPFAYLMQLGIKYCRQINRA